MSNYSSLIGRYKLSSDRLSETIPDDVLEKISRDHCGEWRRLPAYLEIKTQVAKDTDHRPVGEGEKRLEFFHEWKRIRGSGATYKALVSSLCEINSIADAEAVCELLLESASASMHTTVVGGLKSIPVLESDSKALSHNGISESLAQGILSSSSAWKLEQLNNRFDGAGTVIAIFDTAVNPQLPAFLQKSLQNKITVLDFLPQIPIFSIEHGNVCASIAAGLSTGVAPSAELIVYRIAEGGSCDNNAILTALDDVKAKIRSGIKIDVVSMSFDFGEANKEELYRKIKVLTDSGVIVVAASGNRGQFEAHASIPARFDNVISVGALNRNGSPSKFNSCGLIDVFALGENIPTPSGVTIWGTSFATPAISGLVSLLKQCANEVGPPASSHIHRVEILRSIFQKHMITRSDNNKFDVFEPVGFFQRVIDNSNLLNEIIINQLSGATAMEQ